MIGKPVLDCVEYGTDGNKGLSNLIMKGFPKISDLPEMDKSDNETFCKKGSLPPSSQRMIGIITT